jgi:hypothetical protein
MRSAAAMLGVTLAVCGGDAMAGDGRFDWLAGSWCANDGDRRVEEVWLPEAGGAMLGMSRTLSGDRMASFEFMRIAPVDGGTGFIAQPGGSPPTTFLAADVGANSARFENATHDFPTLVAYRRDGDLLHAEISGPGADGATVKIPFEYRRCGR